MHSVVARPLSVTMPYASAAESSQISEARDIWHTGEEKSSPPFDGIDDLRARKMMVVGQHTCGLIHQLSHPVQIMSLQLEAAIDQCRQRGIPDLMEQLLRMKAANDKQHLVIEMMRGFVRGESPKQHLTDVDLKATVQDVAAQYKPRFDAQGIDFAFVESVSSLNVHADPDSLGFVVANIVRNAIDAVRDHSVKRIRVYGEEVGGRVYLSVRDSGHGICAEGEWKLGEPYATTKPDGMGLGLSLSMDTIALLGGRIEARTHPEGGAEFTIVLPSGKRGISGQEHMQFCRL